MSPAGSEGTPSADSAGGGDGEQRLPAGSSIPTERNDGREESGASDGQPDWGAEAEGVSDDDGDFQDTQAGGGDDTQPGGGDDTQPGGDDTQPGGGEQPPAKPAKPAPKEGQDTQPGATPEGEQPSGQDTQPGAGQEPASGETPEQKQAREAKEAEERQKFEQELVEYYKIPDDLAARLSTEPETVLPVLAAKVHQAVLTGLQNYVAQAVPQFFQQHQRVQEANKAAMDTFYGKWPGLRKYEAQVLQVGKMFRQMNPKAKPDESVDKIGKLVCAALGFDPSQFGAQGNGSGQPRSGQPQPRRGAPAKPSGVGGSHAGGRPAAENPWTTEADAMLEEDQQ